MLRGLLLRDLLFVCAAPLFAGCWGTESGEPDTGTPVEEVGTVELGGTSVARAEAARRPGRGGIDLRRAALRDLRRRRDCVDDDGVSVEARPTARRRPDTCSAGVCEGQLRAGRRGLRRSQRRLVHRADTCDGNGVRQSTTSARARLGGLEQLLRSRQRGHVRQRYRVENLEAVGDPAAARSIATAAIEHLRREWHSPHQLGASGIACGDETIETEWNGRIPATATATVTTTSWTRVTVRRRDRYGAQRRGNLRATN